MKTVIPRRDGSKRRVLTAAAAVVAATTLMACGGDATPNQQRSAEAPGAQAPVGCQRHIEVFGAEHWAKELGQPETAVQQNHRIMLWKNSGDPRGAKVGELLVGSRAVILEENGDAYKVLSPLDKSAGWVSRIQVARTLHQDVQTRQPCAPGGA